MSTFQHPDNDPTVASGDPWRSAVIATDASVRQNNQSNTTNEAALGYRIEGTSNDVLIEENVYLGKQHIYNGEAEALAILAALYKARENDITVVYLHTDAKNITDHLNGINPVSSPAMNSVLDPIENVLADFTDYYINYTSRDDTRIETAHDLADRAYPN